MKINNIIVVLVVITCSVIFLISDSKLFYYGTNVLNINKKSLPLNLKPIYMDTHVCYPIIGFSIINNYGSYIIAKGTYYEFKNDTIFIKEVVKYGFNNERLIALVDDSLNNKYYIECTKNTSTQSPSDLRINVFDTNADINKYKLRWVDLKNKYNIYKIERQRAFSIFFIIVTILVKISVTIILRVVKKQS